jgi:hypothetical protein
MDPVTDKLKKKRGRKPKPRPLYTIIIEQKETIISFSDPDTLLNEVSPDSLQSEALQSPD